MHYARHGRYPAALSELAPLFPDGVPFEPYTGEPFPYESTGTTAALRSGQEQIAEVSHMEDARNAIPWELGKK